MGVSTAEHKSRLIAVRLQADILNSPLMLVARTDAEAATMIDSNMDPADHGFIKGATVQGVESVSEATMKGTDGDWEKRAGCMTYPQAAAAAMKKKGADDAKCAACQAALENMSLDEMKAAAAKEGLGEIYFDWEKARTAEGDYRIRGCNEFCIKRAIAWTDACDMLWMETGKPIMAQAQQFSSAVKAAVPGTMLAYNLSPSFNWDGAGMTDAQMESFVWDLAKMGFCWQFITLAGFHCNALSIDLFARDYAKRGALAYVEGIQRVERKEKVETLTHQKWSGADYVDEAGNLITSGLSSTGITSAGVTEKQF